MNLLRPLEIRFCRDVVGGVIFFLRESIFVRVLIYLFCTVTTVTKSLLSFFLEMCTKLRQLEQSSPLMGTVLSP